MLSKQEGFFIIIIFNSKRGNYVKIQEKELPQRKNCFPSHHTDVRVVDLNDKRDPQLLLFILMRFVK